MAAEARFPKSPTSGRRMILGHLLRQLGDQLLLFGSVAHQPGVANELNSTFAEFERLGQDPTRYRATNRAGQHQSQSRAQSQIHDISLIYSRYAQFLGQDRLDPNRGWQNHWRLSMNAFFARCGYYIDSFHEFTAQNGR